MEPPAQKYRVHVNPRISANQLAEYTLASPSRRHSIVKNAKFAPTYLVMRYGAARDAIADFLADPTRNKTMLYSAEADQINEAKKAGTDFLRNDAQLSAEAISHFAGTQFPSVFDKITFSRNTQSLPKLHISNVDVSVNLDLISRNEPKGLVGGAVIQTSKAVSSKSWRDEHCAVVATLAWMQSREVLQNIGKVDHKLCFAIDVFAKKVKTAPASHKKRLKDIEAACTEIAMLWPIVPAPPDFDGKNDG